jgi:hypothetical protein
MRSPSSLSNDVAMPASEQSNGRARLSESEQGVLANLPRTRPQRATRRRIAAREATGAQQPAAEGAPRSASAGADAGTSAASGAATAPAPARAKTARSSRARPRSAARARTQDRPAGSARTSEAGGARKQKARAGASRRTAAAHAPAPRQGFESDSEHASAPVQPPGGAEIMASAAEIVSELAKAGLGAGERLLKDVLARLPLS